MGIARFFEAQLTSNKKLTGLAETAGEEVSWRLNETVERNARAVTVVERGRTGHE